MIRHSPFTAVYFFKYPTLEVVPIKVKFSDSNGVYYATSPVVMPIKWHGFQWACMLIHYFPKNFENYLVLSYEGNDKLFHSLVWSGSLLAVSRFATWFEVIERLNNFQVDDRTHNNLKNNNNIIDKLCTDLKAWECTQTKTRTKKQKSNIIFLEKILLQTNLLRTNKYSNQVKINIRNKNSLKKIVV